MGFKEEQQKVVGVKDVSNNVINDLELPMSKVGVQKKRVFHKDTRHIDRAKVSNCPITNPIEDHSWKFERRLLEGLLHPLK
jgi:hypothetical protein